jgi:adenine deaminase
MEDFIARLPKAELHVHLEGTMTLDTLFKLAEKNNVNIGTREEIAKRRETYDDFMEFQQMYDLNISVIKNCSDLYDITYEYLSKCREENITYTEISFATLVYKSKGFSIPELYNSYFQASADAERDFGVRSYWILSVLKHKSVEENFEMIRDGAPYREKICAIGSAGPEIGNPSSKFAPVYNEARRLGYRHFTAHSGEFGGPEHMIDTLYHLQVTRIDHGVRCLEDEHLVRFLAQSDIWLTVCPLSNFHLQVLDKFFDGEHIVGKMMEKGLKITINSDDPPLLGGFLNDNFKTVAHLLREKGEENVKQELFNLAKNGFVAAFMEEREKEEYFERMRKFAESEGLNFS